MIFTSNTVNRTPGCLSTSGLIEINSIELIKQNIVEFSDCSQYYWAGSMVLTDKYSKHWLLGNHFQQLSNRIEINMISFLDDDEYWVSNFPVGRNCGNQGKGGEARDEKIRMEIQISYLSVYYWSGNYLISLLSPHLASAHTLIVSISTGWWHLMTQYPDGTFGLFW